MADDSLIHTVRRWIDAAGRVVGLTGAGLSPDSGIPDFREPQGLWTKTPEAEKLATLQNYVADAEVRTKLSVYPGLRGSISAILPRIVGAEG